MAKPGGPLLEFADDWLPIFADGRKEYLYLARMLSYQRRRGGARFQVATDGGQTVEAAVSLVTPQVVRIQAWLASGGPPPQVSPLLVAKAQRQGRVAVEGDNQGVTIASGALKIRVEAQPWRIVISDLDGRQVFRQGPGDSTLLAPLALPLGYCRAKSGDVAFFDSFSLETDEHLFGLGEQFGPFDKRGQRIVSWNREPYGAAAAGISYLNIPFLLSSRGYGIFVHHHSKIIYELGQPLPGTASFRVEDPYLDYFFIYGPDLKDVISRYGELTGRPPVPPAWSFGVWMSRCMYLDRPQVEGVVQRLRELGIPADVIHLDPLWLRERKRQERNGCDFVWDEGAFPQPQEFIRWLAERGFRLCLWENPYVWKNTPLYRQGARRGYLVKRKGGGLARPLENPQGAALVDFSNPQAYRWWQDQHRPYLRMGVAAFKPDYGEAVPTDALFADGRSGRQVHNLYPLLYNRAVFEVTQEERGEALVFGRSGYAGSQRYPINWTGDAPSTWGGMAATLRAGLSLSLSGISMWSHDIGGFWNPDNLQPPDPTLYIRWAQFGLLSSYARFHGIRGREPWYYGDKAVEVVREFARLRYRLLPYLYALAHEAAATGLPIVRPLALEYPDDPGSATVDHEYLLGPHLLVVPVMNAEGRCQVYLPPGQWFDWWSGETQQGPKHLRLEVPIERLPLFVRGDTILPLAPEMDYVGQRPWEPLTLDVWLLSSTEATYWSPQERVQVQGQREGEGVRLKFTGPRQRYEVRFHEPSRLEDLRFSGELEEAQWEQEAGFTVVRFLAGGRCALQARLAD